MDWSKAKNVLIILFLALNIVLLVNFLLIKVDMGISEGTLRNTEKVLAERGIAVNCDIPRYNVDNVILNFEMSEAVKNNIIKAFTDSKELPGELYIGQTYILSESKLEIKDDGAAIITKKNINNGLKKLDAESIKEHLQNSLKNIGLPLKDYVEDDVYASGADGKTMRFVEKYKGYLIYDNYFEYSILSDGNLQIEFNYKKISGLKNDRATQIEVKPVYQLLLNNYTKGKASSIDSIDLGFKCSSADADSVLVQERPAWRVMVDGGKADYYSIYTGEVIN